MGKVGKRLASLALVGASAAAVTLGTSGTASADAWFPANSGKGACTSQYALCLWDQSNYQGSGIGITWNDTWKLQNIGQYYGFMGTNISSVINKTGTTFCGAQYNYGAGNTFRIQAWGEYSGLGSWDNRISSIEKWPCSTE
ncbi:peptidase inhibitor family I36 protein [Streptomyces tendae]